MLGFSDDKDLIRTKKPTPDSDQNATPRVGLKIYGQLNTSPLVNSVFLRYFAAASTAS